MKNTFLYKDGEAKLFEESEVEDLMSEGWCDNPTDGAKTPPEDETGSGKDVSLGGIEADASGTAFDAIRHYANKRKDADGMWLVKKGK